MRTQKKEKDPYVKLKADINMNKLVARRCIMEGVIFALTPFFSVPKGTEDIHMVFNATISGLNNYLWYPKFMLPSTGTFLMTVDPKTHMIDLDVGEMFYNFFLSPVLENYCEVDLGSYMGHTKDHQGTPLWMRWV